MPEHVPAEQTPHHDIIEHARMIHAEFEPPAPSRALSRGPSFEMLLLGFVLGVLVAILFGASSLAPALGLGAAVVFAAVDL